MVVVGPSQCAAEEYRKATPKLEEGVGHWINPCESTSQVDPKPVEGSEHIQKVKQKLFSVESSSKTNGRRDSCVYNFRSADPLL